MRGPEVSPLLSIAGSRSRTFVEVSSAILDIFMSRGIGSMRNTSLHLWFETTQHIANPETAEERSL